MKTRILFVGSLFFLSFYVRAQVQEVIEPQRIDILPEYEEGTTVWNKYLKKNLEYPKIAKKNAIQGIVYVKAEISKDGSFSDVTIFKGLEVSCDNAAMDVVKKSLWSPGKIKKGKDNLIPVKTTVIIPITFK